MPGRLALITLLVLQPWWLPGVTAGRTMPVQCGRTSCCAVVETTMTCCGKRTVEVVCHRSGGACRCAEESDDAPQRPAAPAPQIDSARLLPALAAAESGTVLELIEDPARSEMGGGPAACRLPARNARQARLGVWRT